ncbi:MAG: homoserine dehydrogenase [Candidatus Ranarchaeia archaeon]|jgi:homoserine dehydrogenase
MKIVLLGFGNVGQGTLSVLTEKQIDVEIVGIANIQGAVTSEINSQEVLEKGLEMHSAFQAGMTGLQVIEETQPDMIVELTPTNVEDGGVGLKHIKYALNNGIHVVTSNKGPLAVAFPELKTLSTEKGLQFRYEATVAAAIPIFNLKQYCLEMNKINQIHGILNGTSNYILNTLEARGGELSLIVKEAQEKGYAETDPSADLEGTDAAVKLVILANALLGRPVTIKDVFCEGISNITEDAFKLASDFGNTIRLVASADHETLEVRPKIIPKSSTLNVPGALNAVVLKMDVMGDLTLIGPGAGRRETANAVINDILTIKRSIGISS